jgi:hypothetical protein
MAAIEGSDFHPERIDIRGFRRGYGVAPLTGDPNQQFALKGKSAVYILGLINAQAGDGGVCVGAA